MQFQTCSSQGTESGNWGSIVLTAIVSYFLVMWIMPETEMTLETTHLTEMACLEHHHRSFVGTLMSIITEYYTAIGSARLILLCVRVQQVTLTSWRTGRMESTMLPILVLAGIFMSFYLQAFTVWQLKAGMMATTATRFTIDAFGPIADNAGGCRDVELPKEVRKKIFLMLWVTTG